MAKHDTDPVLEQLVRAVNESGHTRVPVTVAAHGTVVTGVLIAQQAYFRELAKGSPLLSALEPALGLSARNTPRMSMPKQPDTCTSAPTQGRKGCGG